ncbi:MAG: hypothetical protein WBD16_11950 [Pyrinomonadaceae bacterium]
MNSSWSNYCLSLAILSLLISLTASYGQSKSVSDDQCVISFLASSTNELRRDVKKDKPPTELGKIDISHVTEGTEINKTYRIRNSQLRVLVELLFDDDLSRDLGGGAHVPTDAMTLYLTVWNGPKRNVKSVLTTASNQTAFNNPYFFRSITSAYIRRGSKMYFVFADCTANSKEENDKL